MHLTSNTSIISEEVRRFNLTIDSTVKEIGILKKYNANELYTIELLQSESGGNEQDFTFSYVGKNGIMQKFTKKLTRGKPLNIYLHEGMATYLSTNVILLNELSTTDTTESISDRLDKLEKKVDQMNISPGMPGYMDLKEHFESMKEILGMDKD